jgi:hypothetical protein
VDDLKGEYARLLNLRAAAASRNAAVVSLRLQGVALACLLVRLLLLAAVHDLARTIIMIVSLSHTFLRGVFCCISRLFLLVSFTPMVLLTLQ